ncbi:TlpA disulfide reductase family protein [Flavivirga spongiicola]|uniref:TlpA family protein disulfide reductase n=1 Tax=Flavivirga spongiicola TaxID=421621 RepID=A0ABU7XW60_9FLAO|nr:TlpA disulfide reductase family protein [Flavivirga sp. MEBiC05379]MDO5980016.1 TlpA disulfide reductase family protein [Flavivirga sp. MEBiC05379]
MKLKLLIVAILIITSCKHEKKRVADSRDITKQEVSDEMNLSDVVLEVYDYNGFEKFLNKKDDKIYVINFWATWCAPCVKELPYFEKLNSQYNDKNVEVILVSLDFPHLYESKLKPFIKKRKLKSKVIALDDVDMNSWIPKVNKDWSGSIPATIIYKNDDNKFFEQSFTYEALETEVKHFLN